jgi:hypothetical protein
MAADPPNRTFSLAWASDRVEVGTRSFRSDLSIRAIHRSSFSRAGHRARLKGGP